MKKLLLVVALCATTAHAEFRTGNKLLSEINSEVPFTNGLALGYLMGVADAGYGTNHCPPQEVTSGQIQDMVRKSLVDTPAVRHVAADAIIYYVLKSVWPCANKPKNSGSNL
jgi:hypothetical protein